MQLLCIKNMFANKQADPLSWYAKQLTFLVIEYSTNKLRFMHIVG